MSKILSLSKVLFLEQFKSAFAKVSPGKKARGIVLAVLLSALILFSIGSSYYTQHLMLETGGMGHYILFYAIVNVVIILLILFTLQIQNVFFEAKDFEFLASLPLKNYEIIVSKLLAQLINAYLISFLILAPSLYFLFLSFSANFLSILFLVLGFVLLPFFNFFVATILSYAVNFIAQFFNNPKRIRNLLSYIFMFGLVILIGFINFEVIGKVMETRTIPNILNYIFPTATQYFYAVTSSSYLSFLIFLGLNLVFMVLIVLLLSKTYFKVNKVKRNVKRKIKGEISFENKSVFKNLVKFEFKRFLSIPIYVFNTSLGAIVMALGALALPVAYFVFVRGSEFEILLLQKEFMLKAVFMVALGAGVGNCTTYASVSIEGQMYYFKKSLPITFEKQMLAKVAVNMLLLVPTLILLTILVPFLIMANLYIYEILLIFALAFVAQLFSAFVGLLANLLFIKLDWTSPTLLVKQSVPTFIYSIMLIISFVGIFSLMTTALSVMSIELFMLLVFLALCLISALLWLLIVTVGKKKYRKVG